MTVGSAKSLPFRRLILLVATYAHLQALLLSSQRREERGSPALGFIALRSYGALLKQVYDCCQYLQMKRAKKGTLFIPCINARGFQAILGVMVSWAELFALIGVLLNVVVVCIMLGEHKHK